MYVKEGRFTNPIPLKIKFQLNLVKLMIENILIMTAFSGFYVSARKHFSAKTNGAERAVHQQSLFARAATPSY